MGAPVVVVGPHRVWRVSAVHVERNGGGHGRGMPNPRPCELVVVGGVAEGAETGGIVGRCVGQGVPDSRVSIVADRLTGFGWI